MHDSKAAFARSFALMSVIICAWIIANYVTEYHASSLIVNDIANKAAYISGYGVVLLGLIFTYYFPVKRIINRFEIMTVSVVSVVLLGLSATYLVAGEVTSGPFGELRFSVGPLLGLYAAGFVALLALITRNSLVMSSRWEKGRKMQARLVWIAFLSSALAGLLLNTAIPILFNNWQVTRLSPFVTVVLVGTIVYAIARHGLFDVRLAIVRTAAYVLSIGTLAGAYYIFAYTLSNLLIGGGSNIIEQSPVTVGLALVLTFFFQPTKRLFDRFTNTVFYKDNYNTDDFFAQLNKILTSTTDLRGLLERAATEIGRTLKSEQAFFFINTLDGHYISAGTQHHKQLPKNDTKYLEKVTDTRDGVIVASLREPHDPIRRLMASHRVEVILPLVQADKIIGYLCLGEHLTSGYTTRDMKVLSTVSDGLSIAIQNALSIQEVKELNETLQQRVNQATSELRASNAQLQRLDKAKDEFVGMASHQLRTPLTSVKGYISMVIEGDVGKITDAQKHLLNEAFTSSERMVHLINDFLNVSRLQTGKFIIDKRPTRLAKVVEQELDSLATTAASRNLTFLYKPPADFPLLDLDEGKMRQVIMNFADNALYYSPEHTHIHVKLICENGEVVFTVKDAGIGVPLAEQSQLFSKFYRASNARKQRPDGTGVGLYLAKKVVDAHGGKVIFESAVGQGSTFGFRLPLGKLASAHHADELVK